MQPLTAAPLAGVWPVGRVGAHVTTFPAIDCNCRNRFLVSGQVMSTKSFSARPETEVSVAPVSEPPDETVVDSVTFVRAPKAAFSMKSTSGSVLITPDGRRMPL